MDDDLELLRLMAAGFHAAGANVEVAADGQAGLARFAARPAALVVTDIVMPLCEGLETIAALKAARPATKVIAISGGHRIGPEALLALARQTGADAVLAKPVRLAELLGLAARLLGSPGRASAA
ncbi:MAG: response regulator [Phenylobacterium sp.]|nr:response regulator [Phenylobacterium sp.]MBP8247714.1 response regulator [Phenylobacterium sp.]